MRKQQPVSDPFALMMNPQRVLAAIERSERLACLQSRICRPLDRPQLARRGAELDEFDGAIDSQPEAGEV